MRADTELHAGKRTTSRRTLHNFGGTPAPEGHYPAPLVAVLIFSYFCIGTEKGGKKEKGKRRKSKANGLVAFSVGQRPTGRYNLIRVNLRHLRETTGNNGK